MPSSTPLKNTARRYKAANEQHRNTDEFIANECDSGAYVRNAIKARNVHELIELAQQRATARGLSLPVSVSYNGGVIPHPNVVRIEVAQDESVEDPEEFRILRQGDNLLATIFWCKAAGRLALSTVHCRSRRICGMHIVHAPQTVAL